MDKVAYLPANKRNELFRESSAALGISDEGDDFRGISRV